MRVFIAIALSDQIRETMGHVIRDMKKSGARANYTPLENMHLTLAFIGETEDLKEIEEALDQVSFQPFCVTTEGFGHFGSLYWVGLEDQPALQDLVRSVRKALSDAGIAFDRKFFKAHITLARRLESRQALKVRIPRLTMKVDSFSLMRSDRIKGRMKYRELTSWEATCETRPEHLTNTDYRNGSDSKAKGASGNSDLSGQENGNQLLRLETDRLVIRQISSADKKDYLYGVSLTSENKAAYQDEELAEILWKDVLEDPDSITMIINDKAKGQVLGSCSFDHWRSQAPEIGINVDPAHHNQGLGTETVKRLTEAFRVLRPRDTLLIRTKKTNISCQKMIEKCGGLRLEEDSQGGRDDLYSYSLLP